MTWQIIKLSRKQSWGHDRVVYHGMIRVPLEQALADFRARGWTWDIVEAEPPLPDVAFEGLARQVLERLQFAQRSTFGMPEYNDPARVASIARRVGARWDGPRR